MAYKVYALHSPKYKKIYIGFSSDLDKRMVSHNEKGTKGWTIKYRPWNLVFVETFKTKQEAMLREKQLKTAKGREFIWSLINKIK